MRKLAIGGEGGWDFLEVDPATQRLFVTRGTHVVVLDLESEKVVGEISDTPGVHGIAFVADLNRGFTSNGGDSSVTAFDTKTLKTLGKVKADGRPDIIYFEPVSRRVFTFNHGSNNTTAIDPDELKAVGTLALGGVPELAVSDEKGHIFVNMENTSEIVEFDARTLKILNRYPLAPGEEPTGLAFDREHRRLFSTCANRKLVVMDADSGRVIQTVEIGPGPDGCIFDAKRNLIFSSNGGDGTVSVIREEASWQVRGRQDHQDPGECQDDCDGPQDASPLPLGRYSRERPGRQAGDQRLPPQVRARLVRRRGVGE